jgi:hypothetical protein
MLEMLTETVLNVVKQITPKNICTIHKTLVASCFQVTCKSIIGDRYSFSKGTVILLLCCMSDPISWELYLAEKGRPALNV